jgi:small subunit ribosomal protein S6
MEGMEQVIQNIGEFIKSLNGQVSNIDKMGRKKLAYEVNKNRDGFYVMFDMELPENKVSELRRHLKLNENVIRELITVQENPKAKC